jgi:putative transposase
MKEWLTAREIASENLPHMPVSESAIVRLAKREAWDVHPSYVRARVGLGGGLEYHYRVLPSLAQITYFQRHTVIGGEEPTSAPKATAALTDRGLKERDARLAILSAFEMFSRGLRLNQQACIQVFCDRYDLGFIKIDDWVKVIVPSVSRRTLQRWLSAKRCGQTDALAVDRGQARAGTGLLDTASNGEVKAFILAWIAASPHLSAEIIRGYCEDHFGAEVPDRNGVLKALPPPRTFQHFIKALKASEKVVLTKITDPDKYRSTMKLSGTGTYRHIEEPNALWMIDASPVDALCLDGRYSMYANIDIATRRFVITLSRTPRASAVGLLIRKTILKYGVAHVIKTDNGSDFVAIATKRLFTNLNIEPDVSDAYSPEQKGHVERVIKTFQHEVCPQLPGYIGHSVADRKAIEGRKSFAQRLGADEKELFEVALTSEQLQRHIDDWLEYVYHEREHGGLKKRTPNQVAAASTASIRRVDERALDALLMPVAGKNGVRTMTKQGIKISNSGVAFHYLTGSILPGTEVFVRHDPIDLGKVYVYELDGGRFLDVAICAELSDINPQAFVKAQKEISAELIRTKEREIKADIRDLKKGPSGIERTIRLAKKKAGERAAASDNVIQLPKREEVHTTPQLAAALEAITRPSMTSEPKSLNAMAAKLHEALLREAEQKEHSKVVHLDPDAMLSEAARRFKWAMNKETEIASGIVPDDDAAIRLVRYKASTEYQTGKDCLKDFGLENTLRML